MTPDTYRLHGTPVLLDTVLRPVVRLVQLGLTLPIAALLAWFQLWWWVPVPVVVGYVAYEVFFWRRGDRVVLVDLLEDRIQVQDPLREDVFEVPLAEITAASVQWKEAPEGQSDAMMVLSDPRGPRLALRLRTARPEPRPTEAVVEVTNAVLGGFGGLRALAPNSRVCRQILKDRQGQGIRLLRERVPAEAWDRTLARLWRGREPDLDLFGYHKGEPDGVVVFAGDRWSVGLDGESFEGALADITTARAARSAVLIRPEDATNLDPQEIPLLLLKLHPAITVAIPAPIAGALGDEIDVDDTLLHTHVPEGANLLWHLLCACDRPDWPPALREAVDDARVAVGALPDVLAAPSTEGPLQ